MQHAKYVQRLCCKGNKQTLILLGSRNKLKPAAPRGRPRRRGSEPSARCWCSSLALYISRGIIQSHSVNGAWSSLLYAWSGPWMYLAASFCTGRRVCGCSTQGLAAGSDTKSKHSQRICFQAGRADGGPGVCIITKKVRTDSGTLPCLPLHDSSVEGLGSCRADDRHRDEIGADGAGQTVAVPDSVTALSCWPRSVAGVHTTGLCSSLVEVSAAVRPMMLYYGASLI